MHLGAQAQDSDSPCSLPLHSPSVPGCVCPLSRAQLCPRLPSSPVHAAQHRVARSALPAPSKPSLCAPRAQHYYLAVARGSSPTPRARQGVGVHAALTSWESRGRRQDVGSSLPAGAEIPRTLSAGTGAGASGTLQSLEGPASPRPLGPCGVPVGTCPGPRWPALEWSVFWVALCPTSSAAVEKQMRGAVSSLPMGPAPHAGPLLCLSHQPRVQAVLGTTSRCLPHPGVQGHHGLLLASLAGQDTQSQHEKLSLEEGSVADAGLRCPAASACPWVGGVLDRKAALRPLGKDNPGPRL